MTVRNLASLALLLLLLPGAALADDSAPDDDDSGASAELAAAPDKAEEPKNKMVLSDSATLTGVYSDVFVLTGDLYIPGHVTGNLFVLAGDVTVKGEVDGDAFLCGGDVNVDGTIHGDLYLASGDVTIGPDAHIEGRVFSGTGSGMFAGIIDGDVEGGAGELIIKGTLHGDVDVTVGRLELGEGARIDGDLSYAAGEELTMGEGASVGGATEFTLAVDTDGEPYISHGDHDGGSFGIGWKMYGLGASFVLGAMLLLLGGPIFDRSVAIARQRTLYSLGLGFALFLTVPVLSIAVAITMVGIPLSMVTMTILGLTLWLGRLVTAVVLGAYLIQKMGKETPNRYLSLLLGLFVLMLLAWIPILGFFVFFASMLIGLGALFATARALRAQPLPA